MIRSAALSSAVTSLKGFRGVNEGCDLAARPVADGLRHRPTMATKQPGRPRELKRHSDHVRRSVSDVRPLPDAYGRWGTAARPDLAAWGGRLGGLTPVAGPAGIA